MNEVSAYLHNASQRDKEELTNLLVIDKLEFNVDKLTTANKQQEQEIQILAASKNSLLNSLEELLTKNDQLKDNVSQLTTENKKFASRNKQLIYHVLYLLVK